MRDMTPEWWERFSDGEDTRTWDELPRVALSIRDDETLDEIFTRAIQEFGIYEADWKDYRLEAEEADDPGVRTRRFMALRYDESPIPVSDQVSVGLTVVDGDGRAVWGRWHYDVTYAELRRASEAGAVHGDPRQIYLYVRPDAAGGGIWHTWELLLQAWEVAFKLAVALATANELHDLYGKVRDRLRGRDVVKRKTQEWLERNGHADPLTHMLRGEAWSARDLAGLLGCTTDEAEQVLLLYGYERSETEGVWIYAAGSTTLGLPVRDLSARVVAAYTEEVERRYIDSDEAPRKELEALLTEILRQALERGEVSDLGHVLWDRDRMFRIPWRYRLRARLFQLIRR
jgi:hypothetical protein